MFYYKFLTVFAKYINNEAKLKFRRRNSGDSSEGLERGDVGEDREDHAKDRKGVARQGPLQHAAHR